VSSPIDRREALKRIGFTSAVVGAAGTMTIVSPAWAQGAARAAVPRIAFRRVSRKPGIILHAGETSMELYHAHPHDPREEVVQPEDIRLQTRLVMRNHKEILDWMGLGWRNVVRLTRYQKDMNESAAIERVLASYFKDWQVPQTVYKIDRLSSPQARLEIDMWVLPDGKAESGAMPSDIKGINMVFPRPEVEVRGAYAPGIAIPADMDLLFFSGLTVVPWDVDPWHPGSFVAPTGAAERSKLMTDNLEQVLKAAGIGYKNIINNVNYRGPGEGAINFGQHWGNYRPCSTSLRVNALGIPGANVLHQLNAAAPRKAIASSPGAPRGVEPILHRAGVALRDLPAAPAIRVNGDADLVFFSGITAYPADVDPWNPGGYTLPGDAAAQEKMLADNVEKALSSAGLSWRNVVVLDLVGEVRSGRMLQDRLGDWRPCRTSRAVPTEIPGATLLCEITAVS
jgi:enamine deaminase RidA (YjgF/YER057c/UK114 family)